jgi:hypothetical protein
VRSIRGRAMRDARKYSVPFAAARRRDMSGPKPREFSNRNVAYCGSACQFVIPESSIK